MVRITVMENERNSIRLCGFSDKKKERIKGTENKYKMYRISMISNYH